MVVGRNLTYVIEGKNQAGAELRSIAVHLRERGEGTALPNGDPEEHGTLGSVVDHVIAQWRELCRQLMRTTGVGHMNFLFAPMFAWIICTPKYLTGGMPLGEVVQVAAAFVTVQAALNWLVDNYQRLADWVSSVNRVSSLLIALDKIDGEYPLTRRIVGPNFGGRSQPVLDICRPPLDCPNLSRVLPSFGQSPVTCLPRHAAVGECQHDIGTGQLVRMASTQADPRFDGGVAPTVAKDPNFARLSGPLYFLRRPAGVQASREAPSPLVPSPRAGRGSCSTQVR
jgi:hypothetical protein